MAWNDNLAEPHLGIASHVGPSLRVVAGPGTGKTFALMRRIARLLEVEQVPPSDILAVTFTRTAAKDLVLKLKELAVPGADEVRATTLHSLCFGLLQDGDVFASTNRVPRPLLDYERDMLVCDLALQFGGKTKAGDLVKAFEAYWSKLQHQAPGWPIDPTERAFDKELKDWLQFHEGMLIGEVVTLALNFLQHNPNVPAALEAKYPYIVVDEYQDLNRADQALIDALATPTTQVTVVGDEDQSIYSFRFAHPEGITQYHASHQGTTDKVLDECRRCPDRVVAMASELIRHNTRVKTGFLKPQGARTGDVSFVQHGSLQEEATNLADFVDSYLLSNVDIAPGEVLVLTPRRQIGYGIRDALNAVAAARGRGWTAQSFFTEECLDTKEAKTGFALLTLLARPDDAVGLRAWLGVDDASGKGRAKTYDRVVAHCKAQGCTPKQAMEALAAGTVTIPHTGHLVARFNYLAARLGDLAGLQGQALVDALFPPGQGQCDEIRAMATTALRTATDALTLMEELRTLATQPELPDDHSEIVRVMSLHKSKGLTSKALILAGCVAGALPTLKKKVQAERMREVEEQRRLLYVALTRTTHTLVISGATSILLRDAMKLGLQRGGFMKGGLVRLQASPFISELQPFCPATERGVDWRKRYGL
jgi:DNA helicase-2/ATP-dependent DNA helicase PcrA